MRCLKWNDNQKDQLPLHVEYRYEHIDQYMTWHI